MKTHMLDYELGTFGHFTLREAIMFENDITLDSKCSSMVGMAFNRGMYYL